MYEMVPCSLMGKNSITNPQLGQEGYTIIQTRAFNANMLTGPWKNVRYCKLTLKLLWSVLSSGNYCSLMNSWWMIIAYAYAKLGTKHDDNCYTWNEELVRLGFFFFPYKIVMRRKILLEYE